MADELNISKRTVEAHI
ncbi:hypothetical protein [Aquimarina discodermiae]